MKLVVGTTLDPRDNYEFEVGVDEDMPVLVTDNESEDESEDSDGETFVPKEGNRTQVTGSEPIIMRDVSSINLRGISEGPLQRLAIVRKMRRDNHLYSLLHELGVTVQINFNARLKEDLRWVWDKLQGKSSTEQKILDSLREQHRIVASLELEHEYQQGEDSGDNEKMNSKPTSIAYRLARHRMTGRMNCMRNE